MNLRIHNLLYGDPELYVEIFYFVKYRRRKTIFGYPHLEIANPGHYLDKSPGPGSRPLQF